MLPSTTNMVGPTTSSFPVSINATTSFVFFTNNNNDDNNSNPAAAAAVPSSSDLLQILQQANYANYIQNYLWQAEPRGSSIFFDTQVVQFEGMSTTT